MKTFGMVTLAVVLALGSTACSKKATGQVVAVVNGEEISQQELNTEIQAAGAAAGVDKKVAATAGLQRLIDRKLLVQGAKKDGLDRTPEYLLQSRRTEDDLLIGLLANKANKLVSVPDSAAVAQYINSHPTLFGARKRYQLEQVAFQTPKDTSIIKRIEPITDWDTIIKMLTDAGIALNKGGSVLDSASIPAETAQKIAELKPAEPFVVPVNGGYVISVIRAAQAVPVNEAEARPAAAALLRRQKIDDSLKAQVASARSAAKIEYQPGFAPTAGAPKAP
jgi:peptidyl-prolyl cis-trans isomerase C